MVLELLKPTPPPPSALIAPEEPEYFERELECGGMINPWWATPQRWLGLAPGPSSLQVPDNQILLHPYLGISEEDRIGTPSGVATFLKEDVDRVTREMSNARDMHEILEWLCYTLGATCGVGLAYTDSNPHIRLYSLPQSQMRGAIGWMYGPPLGRNRTMQLSRSVTADYYRLRLIQHEFGHFLGHYGTSSHSGRREDIMYASLQHYKAAPPRWGKSQRDVEWEVKTFGEAWITPN